MRVWQMWVENLRTGEITKSADILEHHVPGNRIGYTGYRRNQIGYIVFHYSAI